MSHSSATITQSLLREGYREKAGNQRHGSDEYCHRSGIARNDESRYDHRLHGVLLVANGMSARQAALWLNEASARCSAG